MDDKIREEILKDIPARDYRLSLTCGYLGMDLDNDSLDDLKVMRLEELQNIKEQMDYWLFIINDLIKIKEEA